MMTSTSISQPSQSDELIPWRRQEALQFVDIPVLDHTTVAGDEILRFAESGLI